jgi:hypothetical protein
MNTQLVDNRKPRIRDRTPKFFAEMAKSMIDDDNEAFAAIDAEEARLKAEKAAQQ